MSLAPIFSIFLQEAFDRQLAKRMTQTITNTARAWGLMRDNNLILAEGRPTSLFDFQDDKAWEHQGVTS